MPPLLRPETMPTIAFALLTTALSASADSGVRHESLALIDASRDRTVPVEIYRPADPQRCAAPQHCTVVLLGPGYGLAPGDYAFLAEPLARDGHLVIGVQHVLPTDAPLPSGGDIINSRLPMWRTGVENLHFVARTLAPRFPDHDWSQRVLIGHSNGGDIAALLLEQAPDFATTLITLDNRRYPLPRSTKLKLLSLRGSDFAADPGVLPEAGDAGTSGPCIETIDGARHNDMQQAGPAWLREYIVARVSAFLADGRCAGSRDGAP